MLQAASIFLDCATCKLNEVMGKCLLGDNKHLINVLQKYVEKKEKHKCYDFDHFLKMLAQLLILRDEVSAQDIVHIDKETEPLLHREYEEDDGKYKSVSC